MDATVKTKWVAALRSGEYKQGKGRLRTKEGDFCCLGVLCDLHAKEHGLKWDMHSSNEFSYGIDYNIAVLPKMVAAWAGLESDNGQYQGRSLFDKETREPCLSSDNDKGATFIDIAKIIEEKF